MSEGAAFLVVLFRESVLVGETSMSPQRVQQAVQEMGEQYKGNAYHLLQRNCNHFSDDLCQKLTGKEAPLWVSRLCSQSQGSTILWLVSDIFNAQHQPHCTQMHP